MALLRQQFEYTKRRLFNQFHTEGIVCELNVGKLYFLSGVELLLQGEHVLIKESMQPTQTEGLNSVNDSKT